MANAYERSPLGKSICNDRQVFNGSRSYSYVGNTMATFCMQTLGCEVSAIHTVNYSKSSQKRRVAPRFSS